RRGKRQAGAKIDLGDDGPFAKKSSRAAGQESAGAGSGRVLRLKRGHLALVEVGAAPFGAQVEPVLRDQEAAAAQRGVVQAFRPRVLHLGRETLAKAAAQLECSGVASGVAVRRHIGKTARAGGA